MAPTKNSSVKRGFSLRKAFSFQRKTPIRKAKEKIRENNVQTANQSTPRVRQNIRRWTSLICTSQAAVSPQKRSSYLPPRNSYFQRSPLKSFENNNIPRPAPSIRVYTEFGGCQIELPSGNQKKSVDLCNDLAAEYNFNTNHVTDWCLFECLFHGKLERLIEDHETINSICHHWDPAHNGYFVFRTDPSKHWPVLYPELAYSSSILGDKDDAANITEEAQRARVHLLREYLQSAQRFPDLQGPALIHDGIKSGWKKYICSIRGSGVYYCPRRQMKDPKNLKPLCKYDNIEVYTVKHQFQLIQCPTSFCIAIKMHSQRGCEFQDLKFLAFNSKEDLDKWVLALRLAKHGEQLRENYRRALSLKAQLQNLRGQS